MRKFVQNYQLQGQTKIWKVFSNFSAVFAVNLMCCSRSNSSTKPIPFFFYTRAAFSLKVIVYVEEQVNSFTTVWVLFEEREDDLLQSEWMTNNSTLLLSLIIYTLLFLLRILCWFVRNSYWSFFILQFGSKWVNRETQAKSNSTTYPSKILVK